MATPASQVVDRVRVILTDADAPYRWDDPTLLRHLTDGRRDLFRLRPDAFYVSAIVTEPPTFAEELTADLAILEPYVAPLAYFVAAKALMQDAEHAANVKTAEKYMQLYAQGIA